MGMVMLLKPVVPLSPVTVKDTVIVEVAGFVRIVTLDICELVMFPVSKRSTIAPLAVVAGTAADDEVGVGDVVGVGVDVGKVVGVGVGDGEDVSEVPKA